MFVETSIISFLFSMSNFLFLFDNLLNNIDPNQPKFFSSFQSAEHYCSIAQTDNIWIIGGELTGLIRR